MPSTDILLVFAVAALSMAFFVSGRVRIDIVALGRGAWPVQRDGAEPGDHVWVTGRLGASAAAVRAWEEGDEPSPGLRAAFASPRPRVEAARCLVEHEVVDALIDLSDGLAGDLGHIAAASGVRITLEAERIPVAEAAVEAVGRDAAFELALHGGEDYELCFVTDPGVVDPAGVLVVLSPIGDEVGQQHVDGAQHRHHRKHHNQRAQEHQPP